MNDPEKMSDPDLVADYAAGNLFAKSELVSRHRPWLVKFLAERVGNADAGEHFADVALQRAFERAAEFDPEEDAFLSLLMRLGAEVTGRWTAPIYRLRCEIDAQLCNELAYCPREAKKRFIRHLENDTMITFAERLIKAGHDVWEAGLYAGRKAENLNMRRSGESDELFAAIDRCDDADELTALWVFIVDACYEYEDLSDYWDDDSAAA